MIDNDTSILDSIKSALGIESDYTAFDTEIIMHINSALMILEQLGLGPGEGFSISDSEDTWSDFIGDETDLELVKTYVYLKVRLIFDPPTNSFVVTSMQDQANEYEFRLSVQVDPSRIND